MILAVLDAPVLADAIEGDPESANLLTWLAYGGVSSAVEEGAKVEKLVNAEIGVRLGGPALQPLDEAAERRWILMHERLRGLPTSCGLVISGGLLDGMRALVDRRFTREDPFAARHLVAAVASRFASEEELTGVRSTVPGRLSARMEAALAHHANYVVVRALGDRDVVWSPRARKAGRWLGELPVIGRHVARTLRSAPPHTPRDGAAAVGERSMTMEGHTVVSLTLAEFMELDEVPDFSALDGNLDMLRQLFPPMR